VIVVTHGNLPLTRLCLESLLGCTDRPPHEVVVVDNASSDGTPEYLETLAAHDSRLRLILSPRNLGFSAACNVGARIARGELIVFLNNDTVLAPGWLERLLTHLSGDDVGAVNPVTNRVGTEAEVEDTPRTYGEFLETATQRAIGRRGKVRDAQMLAFFCLAIRRSRWEEIGPLDERFGLGLFEDDDYSLRLRASGYRLLCAEDVFVYHFGEGSLGRLFEDGERSALFETNRRRFEAKWNRPWQPSGGAHKARYGVLVERVLSTVSERVPPGSVVATISRGDERLLALEGATGWHFPRDRDGGWAGHYPPDGPAAIAELEKVRRAGARFLLIPASASWWLDHYQELRQHLSRTAEEVMRTEDLRLFELVPRDPKASPSRLPPIIRPVFIIGSPRSGTSVLTWALGQHPNLYPLEETVWFGSFHRGVDRAFELGSRRGDRSQLSAMQISRGEFFRAFGRTIDDLIRSHRQWPAALVGRDVLFARARSPEDPKGRWVDGTPENSFFVEGLTELFPDARFLHLLREPGAVVRSLRGFDRVGGRRHTTSEAYERWLRHVRACIEAEEELGPERVKRTLHRDLVERPERMVRDCLEFLGEGFTPDCLLPLSRRINSSGTPPPPAEEDELRADPGLIAEAEALERRLMGARHLQTATEEAR
jgi:GT2 family glycosyltransferase